MSNETKNLTDEAYWTTLWGGKQHKIRHLRWVYVANRQLAKLFHRALSNFDSPRLIEVGCADSLWLPYLAQTYESDSYGIDFSELGCQLAKRNLQRGGVDGKIFCEDVFKFAKKHPGKFDFVYSMGLIEHFTDTQLILQELSNLLKSTGRMLTVFPNLRGMYTPIARVASPKLLATHQVITPLELAAALQDAGFHVTEFGYTGGALKLSVVDYSPWRSVLGRWGHEGLCKFVNLADIVVGNLLTGLQVPNQQLTSPYVYAISIKS